ncbi:MAG: hypothetical protein Q9216_001577 [Gyalolechia sp. 2 TL-2023]
MPLLAAKPPVSELRDCGTIIEYIQTIATKAQSKRSSKSQNAVTPVATGPRIHPPAYFTVDDELLYNRFHADFGPLHIGHLYRFAVQLHEYLGDPANEERGVVFWSRPDARSRANAACLLACYMVVIQSWPPHLALAPIAQQEQPLMPFRDAGYSQADFEIGVQDVVYGVWKAKEEGLCGFQEFNLKEYERYERVDQGDFNWITPYFVALASPQHLPVDVIPRTSPLWEALPKTIDQIKKSSLPTPFRNVLVHFVRKEVGLIVRLNSQLYSPSYFEALGIQHLDMIFDDGTCPPLPMVRKFIKLAHEIITVKEKKIAIHCKAGLGRTGCLIGAYLIYRHGFTANEVIAFMRFMRPGMVVGPQQHWLHLHQGTFREWWWEEKYRQQFLAAIPTTPTKTIRHRNDTLVNGQTATPPNGSSQGKRSALGELNHNETVQPSYTADENLPAPTPGQPRKASRMDIRHHPYARAASAVYGVENDSEKPGNEVVEMKSHRRSQDEEGGDNEEWETRIMSRRTSSRSPQSNEKRRAVSYSTTTTTTYSMAGEPPAGDIENWLHAPTPYVNEKPSRPKTPAAVQSGSGSGTLGVSKVRASPLRRSAESREVKNGGVRKTSARIGSAGGGAAAASRSRS